MTDEERAWIAICKQARQYFRERTIMNYPYTISVKCPMCGHTNQVTDAWLDAIHAEYGKPFVMTCDNEEGGCDRVFVAKIVFTPSVRTSTVEI